MLRVNRRRYCSICYAGCAHCSHLPPLPHTCSLPLPSSSSHNSPLTPGISSLFLQCATNMSIGYIIMRTVLRLYAYTKSQGCTITHGPPCNSAPNVFDQLFKRALSSQVSAQVRMCSLFLATPSPRKQYVPRDRQVPLLFLILPPQSWSGRDGLEAMIYCLFMHCLPWGRPLGVTPWLWHVVDVPLKLKIFIMHTSLLGSWIRQHLTSNKLGDRSVETYIYISIISNSSLFALVIFVKLYHCVTIHLENNNIKFRYCTKGLILPSQSYPITDNHHG